MCGNYHNIKIDEAREECLPWRRSLFSSSSFLTILGFLGCFQTKHPGAEENFAELIKGTSPITGRERPKIKGNKGVIGRITVKKPLKKAQDDFFRPESVLRFTKLKKRSTNWFGQVKKRIGK